MIDDADALGHALGDLEDVGGHDDGDAVLDLVEQHILDLPGGTGIETGEGFVEDDQPRFVHQGAGQRDLLQHAFGEATAALVGVRGKAKPVEQGMGVALRRGGGHFPQPGDELEVFERRQPIIDHRFVGDPGDYPLGGDRIAAGIDAQHRDRTRIGLQKASDHPEEGCLAGVEFALSHREMEAVDRGTVETLGQVLDLERKRKVGHQMLRESVLGRQ